MTAQEISAILCLLTGPLAALVVISAFELIKSSNRLAEGILLLLLIPGILLLTIMVSEALEGVWYTL